MQFCNNSQSTTTTCLLAAACLLFATLIVTTLTNKKAERILSPFSMSPTGETAMSRRASFDGDVIMTTDEMSQMLYGDNAAARPRIEFRDAGYIGYIRSHLAKPSPNRSLNLTNKEKIDFSQFGQSLAIDRLFRARTGGFFVECGAFDGETFSNTLFLERERNWTGLLIEANVLSHRKLLSKNRKAFVFGGCLNPTNQSNTLMFHSAGTLGGLTKHFSKQHVERIRNEMQSQYIQPAFCVPLGDVLAAIGVNHVDFLSLDVEGAELAILKTIDFSRIRIDAMMIEWNNGQPHLLQDIRRLIVDGTGLYREVAVLAKLDVLFARKDLVIQP